MNWGAQVTALVLWMTLMFSAIADGNEEQRIVCYYTNWSVYRPGTAKYSPQNINPYLCTHLIYAFGGFTKDNTLKPFDKYQDIEKGGYAKFTGLKTYNKNLKTMLAIGGWNEGSSRFSPMVADPVRRKELVKNSVKFLRQNHFDGLDLDWEYPAFRDGGKPRDKNNYASLVQELREEFERESLKTGRPRLLLSMAIPAGIEYLEKGYDLPRLNEYLDFFNLLSYDYHSAYEPAVNHHSPLYGLEEDNEYNYDSELTIDFTINYLLRHDVTPDRLVLGIPTYGRSYTLYNEEANDMGAPADGPGEEGDATREKGYLAYYEICENIEKSDDEGSWEVVQPNEKAMGPYAFKGNQWVGYDDENIVRVKALYVKEKKLGGIMFWSIDNDDFRGKCHGRPYPLIEAAKEALLAGNEKAPQKSKSPVNRKKTRPQSNQRTTDPSNDRKYSSTQRRQTSKISASRKRVNSRLNTRPSAKASEEEAEEPEELETRSTFKESTPKPRATRPRARAGNRRKIENSPDDRESLSNKLTTPEPPTTPDPGSDFKCEDEGFFPHPRDCKKYFWCLDSGPSGLGIVAHQFTCPSGLVFNKAADSCDYPRNVVCPKAKAATTTTKAPPTTRRTTTEKPEPEEEEYEYEDEVNAAEEEEEVPVSTTTKPLLYKTINRGRPTSTEATTTEAPTTEAARGFKTEEEEVEDEEDPRVLKELIDLIKKAGGIEQLEKQLHLQEKSSGSNGETTEGNQATPATISRSLYERVLNRQATRLFGTSTAKATPSTNARNHFQNGPGRAQFEGLDEVPEVKSLRRNKKPQYVTIARQRSSTREPSTEDDEEILADEGGEEDSADVASSEERAVSNFEDEANSPKRVTPSYVNIRRSRPTTPASENDLEKEEVLEENTSKFSRRQPTNRKSAEEEPEEANPIHQYTTTEIPNESAQESTSSKSRYTNIHRFRSTTQSSESEDTQKSPEEPETPPPLNEILTTPEPQLFSSSSPVPTDTTTALPTSSSPPDAERTPTISTTHLPATDSVKLVENSVTEILLTTFPASTTPRTPQSLRTSTVPPTAASSPRPFGYPRRTRPTSSTTPVSSTTEQNRAKVSNRPTRNFARPSSSLQNRVRSRTRKTTVSNDISHSLEDNSNYVTIEPVLQTKSQSRLTSRRGGSRFTSSTRATTEGIQSKKIQESENEATPPTFPSRRRGRPAPPTEATTKAPASSRRRRPTDSRIIRISTENPKPSKRSRSESTQDILDTENVTKIHVFKVPEDASNAIIPTALEKETLATVADDSVTSPTLLKTSEAVTGITEANDIDYTTESIVTTVNYTHPDNSTVADDNEGIEKEDKKSLKRKVLLRRRPVTSTTTEDSNYENKKRRKILKSIRPLLDVSPNSLDSDLFSSKDSETSSPEPEEETTTDLSNDLTTESSNPTTMSYETTLESTTIPTTLDLFTESAETTTEGMTEDSSETTATTEFETDSETENPTTVSSTLGTTAVSDPVSRFVRRKFIRKRPLTQATTTIPPPRKFGTSKSVGRSTTEASNSSILTNRRKGLFVRRRPVSSTQANIEEAESSESSGFWRKYTTAASIGLTPLYDSEVSSSLISKKPDASPQLTGKVSLEIPVLPTLKQLLSNNYESTRSIDITSTPKSLLSNSLSDDYVDYGIVEVLNQFSVLSSPDVSPPNATTSIFRIGDADSIEADERSEVGSNRLGRGRRFQENGDEINAFPRRRTRGRSEPVTKSLSRRRNVRRRGSSRSTTPLHQDSLVSATEEQRNLTSSPMPLTESPTTETVRATTLMGSSIPFPKIDGPVRGFFITKSFEDTQTTTETLPTTTETAPTTTEALTEEWRINDVFDDSSSTTANPISTTDAQIEMTSTTFKPDETTGYSEYSEYTESTEPSTTYSPTTTTPEFEADSENYVNDSEESWEMETTTSASISTTTESNDLTTTTSPPETTYVIIDDKLNESNFSMSESELYSTTENHEATYFTTPSISTFGNEIEDNYVTTSSPQESITTTLSIENVNEEVRIDERGRHSIEDDEEIFVYGESFPAPSASTRGSVVPSSTISSTQAPSPSTTTAATKQSTSVSLPVFLITSTRRPDLRRSRGKVRYRGSLTTTPLPRERRLKPVTSAPRRRVNQRNEESAETLLLPQPSPPTEQPSATSSQPTSPPTAPRIRVVYRGRGRGRIRSTTSTTEQSFPVTESFGITSRNEEIIGTSETNLKNSQSSRNDDQILAESSYIDVLGEMNARNSGHFLRRPVTIRPSTTTSSYIGDETTERRYSSKYISARTESYDQSGRAQELAVSLIDPSTVLSSFETGKETSRYRGVKHQDLIGATEATVRTTQRRRQRPVTQVSEERTTKRSRPTRRPIIDYDYYEDEEIRVSVKPELKDKIYVTSSGKIGCLDQGTFAHPFSCKKFITCAKTVGGHVVPTEYSCPNKLSFDPVGGICNWSAGLGCKEVLQ